jgi:RecA-family ATPase
MNRRIAAFCRLHDVPMSELVGWLFVTGKDKFKIKVASGNGNLTIDHRSVAQITETTIENKIDVCIFDPLVALHGVAENDNVKMSEVIHIFGDIAARCDCAIDVCHHTRKPSAGTDEREFNSDDSRGASGIRAGVRSSRVFNRMSKTEAEKAGVTEEDRVWYIRIDRGKANYVPPAIKATWYQPKSVELLNGEQVGAIAPWPFPGQDGPPSEAKTEADRCAEELFMTLLARLTLEGRTVSDRKGINYAPQLFASEKEAKTAKIGKNALADAMRRLFAAKRIRAEDSGSGGRRVHCIAVV